MIRYLTAGESHGECLVGILEGLPAGLAISEDDIALDLKRRQHGYGRGERMTIESDRARILAGVRYGLTIGSPIALLIENKDWPNWRERMRVDDPGADMRATPLTTPRPGHADYAGAVKYRHRDLRNVIERSSARETAMRVALAAVCRKFFCEFGIAVVSHVTQIGAAKAPVRSAELAPETIRDLSDASPVRALDPNAAREMMGAIDEAKTRGDTLGGAFEVIASGVPAGLGSYVQPDRRLDAVIAQAMLSIPAVKAVGVGIGWDAAGLFGSGVHDEMFPAESDGVRRVTNRAGGIEGGVSQGERIVIRAVMKPLATLSRPLKTVDLATGSAAEALRERSDTCAVPAAAVVGEAMLLLALMNPFLERFGGDSMSEIRSRFDRRVESPWA
ncbi:MAG: chorismate synthase [bacterium]|nr:chorismate synthase [bacterium]